MGRMWVSKDDNYQVALRPLFTMLCEVKKVKHSLHINNTLSEPTQFAEYTTKFAKVSFQKGINII